MNSTLGSVVPLAMFLLHHILLQGYSLTETTCTGTCMMDGDNSTGRVGAPMAGMEVKMVNWEEGNYRVTDTPRPR